MFTPAKIIHSRIVVRVKRVTARFHLVKARFKLVCCYPQKVFFLFFFNAFGNIGIFIYFCAINADRKKYNNNLLN